MFPLILLDIKHTFCKKSTHCDSTKLFNMIPSNVFNMIVGTSQKKNITVLTPYFHGGSALGCSNGHSNVFPNISKVTFAKSPQYQTST
jgi:hypothetical protein